MSTRSCRGALARVPLCLALLSATGAEAQTLDPNSAAPYGPPVGDERLYVHAVLDEAEGRFGSGDATPFRWDGEAWLGTDSNRLWLKSEGFAADGEVTGGDQELLYDRPISSYFDLQAGLRYDLDSYAGRGWAALGVEGLAPYFFQTSATLYASDAAHFGAKFLGSYEELLTQRWILEPLLEINLYTRADAAREVGTGLSELDAGLRVRYELVRKVAPYLGVTYQRDVAPSANHTPDGDRGGGWRLALGLRAWL